MDHFPNRGHQSERATSRRRVALVWIVALALLAGLGAPASAIALPAGNIEPARSGSLAPAAPEMPRGRESQATALGAPGNPPGSHQPPLLSNTSAGLSARAAFVVDLSNGVLIYSENADEQLPPASTLKIVTALTVLRVLDPDEVISITEDDMVDRAVYSNAQLEPGDEVTVRNLLAGLLLPSGGDAALALARVAGARLGVLPGENAVQRFVEEMNAVAAEIGMTSSRFLNPVGMDDDGQFSTARDLAIAGAALLRDPTLAPLVALPELEIDVAGLATRSILLVNTNELLPIDRVHGVKTGTTETAGQCLVLATRRSSAQILTVILGSEDRYADTQQLLSFVDERIEWVSLGSGESFPELERAADVLGFTLPVTPVVPMNREQAGQLHYRFDLGPRPAGSDHEIWGSIVFLNDGTELYRLPVLVDQSATGPFG
jgi:serine-type D-Ala-D-Ala carboxypeptidase (penicillin-binding protein 5/6)